MFRVSRTGIAVSLALAGCAQRTAEPPSAAPPSGLAAAVFPDPRPERDGFVPRRRLEHTVTLGQDAFLPGAPPRGTPPQSSAPLTIQNNVYVTPPPTNYGYGYGYGGYGLPVYSTGSSRSAPVNPVTGTPPVAGDWPAAPSYGPRPMR